MKGRAKLVRCDRHGTYKVLARNFIWQRWKPLLDNNGKEIEFHTFEEFGEITKIESFGEITIKYDNYQGM